jgi:hypothetical protein
MGWSWCQEWEHRKDIIADLTRDESSKSYAIKENKPTYSIRKCIKHCFRGNNFSGVLWTVWDIFSHNVETDKLIKTDRYIGCDLLGYYKTDKCWGHKALCESSHPFYYSCPLGYLDMVPVSCKEWREKVKQYHSDRKLKFEVKIGDFILLKDRYSPRVFKIKDVRPIIGINHNIVYKISPKQILRAISVEERKIGEEECVKRISKFFPGQKEKIRKTIKDGILDLTSDIEEICKI